VQVGPAAEADVGQVVLVADIAAVVLDPPCLRALGGGAV
jgi:hypothetical protein